MKINWRYWWKLNPFISKSPPKVKVKIIEKSNIKKEKLRPKHPYWGSTK